MMYRRLISAHSWPVAIVLVLLALTLLVLPGLAFARANAGGGFYQQTNLVSNLPGKAHFTDANLTNPWGISVRPWRTFLGLRQWQRIVYAL